MNQAISLAFKQSMANYLVCDQVVAANLFDGVRQLRMIQTLGLEGALPKSRVIQKSQHKMFCRHILIFPLLLVFLCLGHQGF